MVELPGAAFIVALDERMRVHLVGTHKYPNDVYSVEVPGGGTEGQDPLVAAKRELQEEAGKITDQQTITALLMATLELELV